MADTQPAQPQPSILDKFMSLDAVAEYFDVSRHVVNRWHERDGLPVIKLCKGHYLVHEDDLAQWLRGRVGKIPAESEG